MVRTRAIDLDSLTKTESRGGKLSPYGARVASTNCSSKASGRLPRFGLELRKSCAQPCLSAEVRSEQGDRRPGVAATRILLTETTVVDSCSMGLVFPVHADVSKSI